MAALDRGFRHLGHQSLVIYVVVQVGVERGISAALGRQMLVCLSLEDLGLERVRVG